MKTLKLEIELIYDDDMMHSGDGDKDAKEWFFSDVLSGELELFDKSDIGDEIGKVKIIRLIDETT